MRHSLGRAALGATVLAMAAPALAQNAGRGSVLFSVECAACHSTIKDDNGIGPSLYGIYGTRAGTVPGYQFSAAMKDSPIVWSTDTLRQFLTDPATTVSGTRMPHPERELHLAEPDAINREDIVAYLKTLGK